MLLLDAAQGAVYFDNVQLEQSGGPRQYNLVENSDFADAPGAQEYATGTCPTSWVITGNDPLEGTYVFGGRNWVWLSGSPAKVKKVSQSVPVNASAGETLIIGGKAISTPIMP